MMDAKQRKEALKLGGPSKPWQTECLLGGYYGEEEVEAAVRAIRGSMDPTIGFGFECEELDESSRRSPHTLARATAWR